MSQVAAINASLSVAEMATDLGVSHEKVRYWIVSNRLPAIDIADGGQRRHYRVAREDWDAFKKSRMTQRPTTQRRQRHEAGTNLLGI